MVRKTFGFAAYAFILAFGLFLTFLIPFNDQEGGGLAEGLIGLSFGLEWLLTGLLTGLITTRRDVKCYNPLEDIMLCTMFGFLIPIFSLYNVLNDHLTSRKRMASIA
jgi:hypothetical protein